VGLQECCSFLGWVVFLGLIYVVCWVGFFVVWFVSGLILCRDVKGAAGHGYF
jgi:hypothetical protein